MADDKWMDDSDFNLDDEDFATPAQEQEFLDREKIVGRTLTAVFWQKDGVVFEFDHVWRALVRNPDDVVWMGRKPQ